GVLAGFLKFPADPVDMGRPTPLSGGKITALCTLDGGAPATPMKNNRYWQELNKRIGGTYEPTLVPADQYASKFATVVAGDELPDIATIPTGTPSLPKLLETKFADLTELLSGDGIAEFPSLANIPPSTWRNTVFNGRIYGVPIHRGNAGSVLLSRDDLRESLGATGDVTDADSFVALCEEVTSEKDER